jgi:hypothetical protein
MAAIGCNVLQRVLKLFEAIGAGEGEGTDWSLK